MMRMVWSASLFAVWSLTCWTGDAGVQVSVRQEPRELHVTEGENVTMNCSYSVNSTEEKQIRVWWILSCNGYLIQENKNCSKIRSNTYNITGKQQLLDSLSLTSVRRHQGGTYICQAVMEIPELFERNGNGTLLVIKASDSPAAPSAKGHISIILYTALTTFGLMAIFFIIYCRKKGNNRNSSVQRKSDCRESHDGETDVQYATLNLPTSPCVSETAAPPRKKPSEGPPALGEPGKEENADVVYSHICTSKHSRQTSRR